MIILIGCGIVVVKLKSIDKASVEEILNGTASPSIEIRGKIGRGSGFGFIRNGNGLYGEKPGPGGIYQRRVTGYNQHGRIPGRVRRQYFVRMKTYRPTNPRTDEQQAGRNTFADAVAAWQSMTTEQRKPYNDRAIRKSRRGRNLFISEYMLQS